MVNTDIAAVPERQPLMAWRKERGLTQFELAALAKVSLSTITNVEQSRQEPSVTIAQRIAGALGLRVEQVAWPTADTIKPRKRSPKEERPAA